MLARPPLPHPVAVWAAGKDAKTKRDIGQLALLGSGPQFGTGMYYFSLADDSS
jgi:hypothetical protein